MRVTGETRPVEGRGLTVAYGGGSDGSRDLFDVVLDPVTQPGVSNSDICSAPASHNTLMIVGARKAVIQSSPADSMSSLIRAWVIMLRSAGEIAFGEGRLDRRLADRQPVEGAVELVLVDHPETELFAEAGGRSVGRQRAGGGKLVPPRWRTTRTIVGRAAAIAEIERQLTAITRRGDNYRDY
jgi:hypothetical protein